ncbi:hypothetical protein Pla108_42250 [Botrimarina colliarenosi]|uniref:Uncharacterized protein n=1 Tax=Botrimarina colliarenosi TaxID=2528001 RepID=A0A5C5ZX24_9BACT|nr:hypothetical protein Pla108_42250 [Botrimarina colliarenosi]
MAAQASKPRRLPAYAHFKPRDLACVWVHGKRIYLGKYGSPESHARYAEVVKRILAGQEIDPATLSASRPAPAAVLTVGQLADRYGQHAAVAYRKNGRPTSEVALMQRTLIELKAAFGDPKRPVGRFVRRPGPQVSTVRDLRLLGSDYQARPEPAAEAAGGGRVDDASAQPACGGVVPQAEQGRTHPP